MARNRTRNNLNIEKLENEKHIQRQGFWGYSPLYFLLMAAPNSQSKALSLKSSIECAFRAVEFCKIKIHKQIPLSYVSMFRAHWLLGAAYRANNELTLAEENLSKALNLCRQINNVEHEADILLDLGRLRYAQGDFKRRAGKSVRGAGDHRAQRLCSTRRGCEFVPCSIRAGAGEG